MMSEEKKSFERLDQMYKDKLHNELNKAKKDRKRNRTEEQTRIEKNRYTGRKETKTGEDQ